MVNHETPHDEIGLEVDVEVLSLVDPSLSKPQGDGCQVEPNRSMFQGDCERILRKGWEGFSFLINGDYFLGQQRVTNHGN